MIWGGNVLENCKSVMRIMQNKYIIVSFSFYLSVIWTYYHEVYVIYWQIVLFSLSHTCTHTHKLYLFYGHIAHSLCSLL